MRHRINTFCVLLYLCCSSSILKYKRPNGIQIKTEKTRICKLTIYDRIQCIHACVRTLRRSGSVIARAGLRERDWIYTILYITNNINCTRVNVNWDYGQVCRNFIPLYNFVWYNVSVYKVELIKNQNKLCMYFRFFVLLWLCKKTRPQSATGKVS